MMNILQSFLQVLFLVCVTSGGNFAYTVNDVFKQTGLDFKGAANYVPLGLTAKEGMDNMWHTYADTLNNFKWSCDYKEL